VFENLGCREIEKTLSRAKSAKDAKKKRNKENGGGAFANLACLARGNDLNGI
jgi:hypothetical protein